MKILLFTLASFLFFQGLNAEKTKCHQCKYTEECPEEGTEVECTAGVNCIYSLNGDNKKSKSCYDNRGTNPKPELKALVDLNKGDQDMKLDGCIDITEQKEDKQAYKTCICAGTNCNTNDKIKDDMIKSKGEEGERECYSCGKLSDRKACTEDELKEKKTTKCEKDSGNCFVVKAERQVGGAMKDETYRGCMLKDSENTYGYGSISFEKAKEFKGDYYICNKNKCNLDKETWKDSSVAGLTSSIVLLFVGLFTYQLFN